MAYTPTTWVTGDTITAVKLNNMEQGIANAGVLAVTVNNGTLDKTWQEIHDATFSVLTTAEEGQMLQMGCIEDEGAYLAVYWTFGMSQPNVYIAESASGYPVRDEG